MKLAVFIERDGILNRVQVQGRYPVSPLTLDEFEVNLEAIAPIRLLKNAGFLLIATTNQPGLSRGHLARRELDAMHAVLRRAFLLDDILVCPHEETDHCPCRKPKPGLLREAAYQWHIDLDHSFVISDKWQDAEAARTAGCTSLLLSSPWVGKVHHDFVLPGLSGVVSKLTEFSHHGRYQMA
ncbi:MAG: HAD-IIIA family hydrolase [Verrucomicrobia bacterium]|nr:HAD-IIIA family hydrolase [Verrucomicrobiota bacterium]